MRPFPKFVTLIKAITTLLGSSSKMFKYRRCAPEAVIAIENFHHMQNQRDYRYLSNLAMEILVHFQQTFVQNGSPLSHHGSHQRDFGHSPIPACTGRKRMVFTLEQVSAHCMHMMASRRHLEKIINNRYLNSVLIAIASATLSRPHYQRYFS